MTQRKKKSYQMTDSLINLRFICKGTLFLMTGSDKRTGEWLHDIKNLSNGKRVYGVNDKKIMRDMNDDEKEYYTNNFMKKK